MPRFLALLLAAALITTAPASAAPETPAAKRHLTVGDYFALSDLRQARISPDGNRIAYTASSLDLEKDRTETALFMVAADGNAEPWRLSAPGTSAGRPRWSPDGGHLAFLSARPLDGDEDEPRTQVWAFDLRGGDAQPWTEVQQGVESFDFSPDGRRLLLTLRDPKPEDLLDEAERAKRKPEPHVIDRLQFKRDYEGYLDRRRAHLYVFDLADKSLRQITSGDFEDSDGVLSPDGRLVAFSSNRTEEPDGNRNSDLFIVSADNTDQGTSLRRLTSNAGWDHSPAWSPDGRWLAYVTGVEPELMWYATDHLAVIPAAGGEPRILTRQLDRFVAEPRFAPDGGSIYFLVEDSGNRHLARIAPGGGPIGRPIAGERSVRAYSVSREGALAALVSEPLLPHEVFLAGNDPPTRLTHVHRRLLGAVALGQVETHRFKSADGTEIEGFITLPPDYDQRLRYPTLLRIHGGPVGQYDSAFHFESQLFAAHGYVVVRANPRGSSGYGQPFSAALFADWGNKDYEDVMAAVDHAIELGYADPEHLGVGGWSYGGILTNYVITKTDRFKAAITGASEVLYAANYGHDHYQLAWEEELGLPWENRELWERLSPWNAVEKITTPTLILCGALDWNVPVLNSEQLYQALRRLGRTTQLIVYPEEHHGIRRPSFQQDRYQRYLDWYNHHVKSK